MTDTQNIAHQDKTSAAAGLGWVALGAVLMLFTNGTWMVPLLVWLAPVPWLIYLDRSSHRLQLPLLLVANVLVHFVVWRDIIPAPGLLYYLIAATYAFAYLLPFAAYRYLAAGNNSSAVTLVFPVAWVALEFVFQRWVTPYGSWASFAYTQADNLVLLQVVSIAGLAGLSFLMTWTAAIIAWCLRLEASAAKRLRGAASGALLIMVALLFGQLRLAQPINNEAVLRTAGLAPDPQLDHAVELAIGEVRRGTELAGTAMDKLTKSADLLNTDLLERTRREARAGADLVAWSETAARVLKSGEDRFIERISEVAQAEGITILAAMGVWNPDGQPLLENKVVAIDARGRVAWHFHKARPIVGAESMLIDAGENAIATLELEQVRLGIVICHDMDFPDFVRQASRAGVDLLVAPSNDWPLIAKLHADMATLRAVENGVTMLRPTSGGRSIVVDSLGRRLAVVDYPEITMIALAPANAIRTVYGLIGDTFAWLCLIALVGMTAVRLRTAAAT